MSTAADALRAFITPLLPGWRVQFGRWVDGSKTDRYAILRPVGGMPASLVRRPAFTLLLIGAEGDTETGPFVAAQAIVEAMRNASGTLVSMQAGEPVLTPTSDGRPGVELSITTITN